jgi:glucosamine-6-phosphate isomerase
MIKKMKVFHTDFEASKHCRDMIENIIKEKEDALICLAAGHTSLPLFEMLIEGDKDGSIDFSKVKIVGLDEWVGLSGRDDGSCERFLRKNLFDHINILEENIRLFDGEAQNLLKECAEIEAFINENGDIDYMLLGVGMNGHLGLNEPGVDKDSTAGVVMLDSVTKRVADKYFQEKPELMAGVTLGMKDIKKAKIVEVLVTGQRKKDIVKRIVDLDETNQVPATIIKSLENVIFIFDDAAAGLV